MKRYGKNFNVVMRAAPATFNLPLSKKVKAGDTIFVCPWSDFFHPAADNLRPAAWEIIRRRPDVLFLIVTKRPERWAVGLPKDWGQGWPNVMLVVTAEDQASWEMRARLLAATPAQLRGVSIEPCLGPIEMGMDGLNLEEQFWHATDCPGCCEFACGGTQIVGDLHWIIVGGETGPQARPMHPAWVRGVRDQCAAAGVPFYFKQWGEWRPLESGEFPNADPPPTVRVDLEGRDLSNLPGLWDESDAVLIREGHKAAGRQLDGREHLDLPNWTPGTRQDATGSPPARK
jgi:protein gp37